MEGPLSKWTNVMQGWQFRWFVLDDNVGVLSYYTSKEKMNRGQRRGAVRLKGAIIAIEDEDDSAFTVTTDQKTFHFQARDADERERWLRALELVIHKHSGYYKPRAKKLQTSTASRQSGIREFDRRLSQADQYLQLLIEQVQALESTAAQSPELKTTYTPMIESANAMLDTVKHAIVIMQMTKNQVCPVVGQAISPGAISIETKQTKEAAAAAAIQLAEASKALSIQDHTAAASTSISTSPMSVVPVPASVSGMVAPSMLTPGVVDVSSPTTTHFRNPTEPPMSFSSSEDEEFEDAMEDFLLVEELDADDVSLTDETAYPPIRSEGGGGKTSKMGANQRITTPPTVSTTQISTTAVLAPTDMDAAHYTSGSASVAALVASELEAQPDFHDDNVDFDAIYEDDTEDELGNVQEHGSVIMHLLSQVSIGMDLTKIPLPTFILERRSLLEMYADFFAHPDLFVSITEQPTAEERFIAAVRWYMSSFHAGRRCSVAKKPYNPILGETFRCYWDVPNMKPSPSRVSMMDTTTTTSSNQNGSSTSLMSDQQRSRQLPFPAATNDQLTFVAEQVSHHPPISAFYAEHPAKRMQCAAHIWTKSKFLGLSIGVHMVGQGCISLLDYDEHYVATFPSGYGRSILTVPWVELGGKVHLNCEKTGYNASVQFHTKPFYGGKTNLISGELYRPNQSKPFMTIRGEWNGLMTYKFEKQDEKPFLNVARLDICRKQCRPVNEQGAHESRKLWRHVTYALKNNDIHMASSGKHWLEQRQRLEHKYRAKLQQKWNTGYFREDGEQWIYKWPLSSREKQTSQNDRK